MISKLTSYDNATVGSGSIVNEVAFAYNSFGQITSDSQSHSGAVGGGTPQVQYAYTNGSTNMIRPTTLTYPNARAITIGYGTSGGINDSSSRVDNLTDGATTLVNYAYLGLGTVVQTTYPQPSTQHTLLGSSGGNSPAGDIYWGLDLFGRIIDSRWYNTGTSADVDRIKYGYDRASNRIWRQNPVATAAGASFDEHYSNDGLERLKDMQRGTLNGTNTAITSPNFAQCWTLDPTGNWQGFNESKTGSSWTLNQTRSANPVNEITGITSTVGATWVAPAYDAAGNMTTMPQPATPENSYTATYDAWNRLVKLVDAMSSQTVQQNQYDARTFRTVVRTYAADVLSDTRHSYSTTGWQTIEERVDTATTADKQFVWRARYIDDLVLRDHGSERLYALQDANWDVTTIVNSAGSAQERYAYSAYGTPTLLNSGFGALSGSLFTWKSLFCGYHYDNTPCLYVARFRIYHSQLGVWCQTDPLQFNSGLNFYEYVSSTPLNWADPLGLSESGTVFWAFFGKDYVRIDVEPLSDPPIHAHYGKGPSASSNTKVHFVGNKFENINSSFFKRVMKSPTNKKLLQQAVKKAKKLAKAGQRSTGCVAFGAGLSLASVALAGSEGGYGAAASEAVTSVEDAVIGVVQAGLTGLGTHAALTIAGVTVTGIGTGGGIGAGATIAAGGAIATGGLALLAAGGGYYVGTAIANTKVQGNTVAGHLGNGLHNTCPWCFSW